MYSKRVKITITIIVIAGTLLLSCLGSYAATATAPTLSFTQQTGRAYLLNSSDTSDSTGYSNDVLVYRYDTSIKANIPVIDGYWNGLASYNITVGGMSNTGFTFDAINWIYTPFDNQNFGSGIISNSSSSASRTTLLRCWWENYYTPVNGNYPVGNLSIIITGTFIGTSIPSYIDISTITISLSGSDISVTPEASSLGLAGVIKTGILDALNTDINTNISVADYLDFYLQYLYNTSSSSISIDSQMSVLLDDITEVLSNQTDAYIKLGQLYTTLNDFWQSYNTTQTYIATWLNTIINKLDILINTGSSSTEYQSDIDEANARASSIQDALDVNQPNMGSVIAGFEGEFDDYVADGSRPYFWANNGRIAAILAMTMVTALIGFVLYGKSG